MAKTNESQTVIMSFTELFRDRFSSYAKYVVGDRALPDPRDGLKPVQRRNLFTLFEMGLVDGIMKKSARSVGQVMGKYHPHGDSSIYDNMVRMSQDFNYRYILSQFMGNNGSIDNDPAAAMRYTESGLSKYGKMLVGDLKEKSDTVDFQPNYDEEETEPTVLAGIFPNMLVNGIDGIAVGIASDMPPHQLGEIIDTIIKYLANPDISISELALGLAPDLPTGGKIRGDFASMYKTGKGKFEIFSKISEEPIELNGKRYIEITEIPFGVTRDKIMESLETLVDDGKELRKSMKDVSDEEKLKLCLESKEHIALCFLSVAGLENMRILIEYQEGTFDRVIELLNTQTRSGWTYKKFHAQFQVFYRNKPQMMNLKQLVQAYVLHQKDVSLRYAKHELNQVQNRLHILEGFIKIIDKLDHVIQIIRESDSPSDAEVTLQAEFGLSEVQSDKVINMRLGQLSKLSLADISKEYADKQIKEQELIEFLNSDDLVVKKLISDLSELKEKHNDTRRTAII